MSQVEVSFSPLSDSSLNRLNKWINEKEKHKDFFIEESLLDRTGTGYFSRKQASRYMQENNFPYISK